MTDQGDPASVPGSTPWFRRWFGEEYLRLYPHRDRDEARDGVELLLSRRPEVARGPVLDLACGAGRHLDVLSTRGVPCVGLDLSLSLLSRAHQTRPHLRLVRGDMRRLPFNPSSFSAVTSFFTSFGYFDSEEGDRRVAREVHRVLRPGGTFFLDFLNAHSVLDQLIPRDEHVVEGRRVIQERRVLPGGRIVEKRIRIETEPPDDPDRTFVERVRLYTADELSTLLAAVGLETSERFGDYKGGAPSPASPRAIIVARAR